MKTTRKQEFNFSTLFPEAFGISYTLFKIIIPVSIITKILTDLGLTKQFGQWLSPVMEIIGLPGDMGLVWATAMLTNLYAGMVVFSSIGPSLDLTVAQVTILGTIMLVAHALPVELRIAQRSGPRFRVMSLLRLIGAFLLGWLLHKIYSTGGFLQTSNITLWNPTSENSTWASWLLGEGKKLISIFLIITTLLFTMKVLHFLGGIKLLTKLLGPPLSLLGMSEAVVPLIIVSMTLGLSYGGGLIINEAKTGRIKGRDIFCALALMSLCHSVVEDTLLMMLIGSHLSGIFFARICFSFIVIFLIARGLRLMGDESFNRFLFRSPTR